MTKLDGVTTAARRLRESVNATPDHTWLYYDLNGHCQPQPFEDLPDALAMRGRAGGYLPRLTMREAVCWMTVYREFPGREDAEIREQRALRMVAFGDPDH